MADEMDCCDNLAMNRLPNEQRLKNDNQDVLCEKLCERNDLNSTEELKFGSIGTSTNRISEFGSSIVDKDVLFSAIYEPADH